MENTVSLRWLNQYSNFFYFIDYYLGFYFVLFENQLVQKFLKNMKGACSIFIHVYVHTNREILWVR